MVSHVLLPAIRQASNSNNQSETPPLPHKPAKTPTQETFDIVNIFLS